MQISEGRLEELGVMWFGRQQRNKARGRVDGPVVAAHDDSEVFRHVISLNVAQTVGIGAEMQKARIKTLPIRQLLRSEGTLLSTHKSTHFAWHTLG